MKGTTLDRLMHDFTHFVRTKDIRFAVPLSVIEQELYAQELSRLELKLRDDTDTVREIYRYSFDESVPEFYFRANGVPQSILISPLPRMHARIEILPKHSILKRALNWVAHSNGSQDLEEIVPGRIWADARLRMDGYISSSGPMYSFITRGKNLSFFVNNRWITDGQPPKQGMTATFVPVVACHRGQARIQARNVVLGQVNLEQLITQN